MPLETTDKRILSPQSRAKHEHLISLQNKVVSKTFNKLCRIIDDILDETVLEKGKFIYTRAGFLLGHSSRIPHVDLTYFWDVISMQMIGKTNKEEWAALESKMVLKTIGAFVMYRVALRPERWIVNFFDSERYDCVTGKEIKIAEYFVADEEKKNTVADLVNKFRSFSPCH